MENAVKLVVFGHTTRDYIVEYGGRMRLGCLGGGGPNAAAGAAYWCANGEVGLVCRRTEKMPDEMLRPLATHPGINAQGVRVMAGEGIKLWLLYDRDGYRHWVLHHDSASREEAAPLPEDMPASYRLAKGFHFAPLPPQHVLQLMDTLPSDALIQLDPHYEWFFQKHKALWDKLLPKVSILTPSEDEFTKFWEIPYGQPLKKYVPYIKKLAAMGPGIIILKMGPVGAVVYQREGDRFFVVPPFAKDEDILDATGAGDTFCGSFFINYLNGRALVDAVVCGMVGSFITMGRHGVSDYLAVDPQMAATLYPKAKAELESHIVEGL